MPIRESVVLLAVGVFIYMGVITFAEASEQTVLQKIVPFAQQGRVFGFAMAVELAAAPISTLDGRAGRRVLADSVYEFRCRTRPVGLAAGIGHDPRDSPGLRVLASLIGIVVTVLALASRPYRVLSGTYRDSAVNEMLASESPADRPQTEPPSDSDGRPAVYPSGVVSCGGDRSGTGIANLPEVVGFMEWLPLIVAALIIGIAKTSFGGLAR